MYLNHIKVIKTSFDRSFTATVRKQRSIDTRRRTGIQNNATPITSGYNIWRVTIGIKLSVRSIPNITEACKCDTPITFTFRNKLRPTTL
jgi:hypothetical protein